MKIRVHKGRRLPIGLGKLAPILKVLILTVLLIFLAQLILKSSLLKIKYIYVYSEKEIPQAFLVNIGDETYFTLNENKIKQALLKSVLEVESINIKLTFPNTINLFIKWRSPLALATESYLEEERMSEGSTPSGKIDTKFIKKDEPYFLIDRFGVLFNGPSEENLPVMGVDLQNMKVGDRIEKIPAESMLQILQFLKNTNDMPLWIASKDQKIVMGMKGGEMVITESNGDIEKEMSSLQLIINRFRIEGRKVDYIDLRFGKPVIKYSND